MNKHLMITILLLCTATFTLAQQSSDNNDKVKPGRNEVTVTKGYYSIYKNSEKLKSRRPLSTVKVDTSTPAKNIYTKGFYAIGDKHKQVHKAGRSFIAVTPKRPVATKGYYSIQPSANRQLVKEDTPAEVASTGKSVINTQDSVQVDR